jgi:predicted ArsR family transcriptional regulator
MKVAVMQQAGISRGEISERLGVSARAVRDAVQDLQAIAPTHRDRRAAQRRGVR